MSAGNLKIFDDDEEEDQEPKPSEFSKEYNGKPAVIVNYFFQKQLKTMASDGAVVTKQPDTGRPSSLTIKCSAKHVAKVKTTFDSMEKSLREDFDQEDFPLPSDKINKFAGFIRDFFERNDRPDKSRVLYVPDIVRKRIIVITRSSEGLSQDEKFKELWRLNGSSSTRRDESPVRTGSHADERIVNAYHGAMGSRSRAANMLYDSLIRRSEGFTQLVDALGNEEINNTMLADLLDPSQADGAAGGMVAPRTSPTDYRQQTAAAPDLQSPLSPGQEDIQGSDRANGGRGVFTLDTPWNKLPVGVHNSLRKMDRHGAVSGPDDLAEITDLVMDEYETLKERVEKDKKRSLTIEIINKWKEKEGQITLKDLYRALAEMERVDILTEIERKTKVKAPEELQNTAEPVEGQPQDDQLTNDQPQVDNVERQEEEQNFENELKIVESTENLAIEESGEFSLHSVADTSNGTMMPVQRVQTMQHDVNRINTVESCSSIQPMNPGETNRDPNDAPDSNSRQYSVSHLPQPRWSDAVKTKSNKSDTRVNCNLPSVSTDTGSSAISLPSGNLPTEGIVSQGTALRASLPTSAVIGDTSITDNTAVPLASDETRAKESMGGVRYSSGFQDIRYPGPIPATNYVDNKNISETDIQYIDKDEMKKQQPETMQLETREMSHFFSEQLEVQASPVSMTQAKTLSMTDEKTLVDNINCDQSKVMVSKSMGDLTSTDSENGGDTTLVKTIASTNEQSPNLGEDTSNAEYMSGRESLEVSNEDNAEVETTYLAAEGGAPGDKGERVNDTKEHSDSSIVRKAIANFNISISTPPPSEIHSVDYTEKAKVPYLSCERYRDHSLEDLKEERLAMERDMNYSQEMRSIEKKRDKKLPFECLADYQGGNANGNEPGDISVEDYEFDGTNNSVQSDRLMNEATGNDSQAPQDSLESESEQQQQSNIMPSGKVA